ncbi:MAG: hypothetical protein ACYCQK_01580 [Acidiferrobacteraceae bacterium]
MKTSGLKTQTVTVTRGDIDYEIACEYELLPGSPDHFIPGGSWDQGEPAAVELREVVVEKIVVWCGDYGVSAIPDEQRQVDRWATAELGEEIRGILIRIETETEK